MGSAGGGKCNQRRARVAQTTTVIPPNEAAAHVGEYATVEGVVAKVFTSKAGNTFLNIGAAIFQFRLKQDSMNGEGSGRVLVAQPLRIFLAPHQRLRDHFVLIGAGEMPQKSLCALLVDERRKRTGF